MKQLKKSVAYVLAFITVFSSFTILPSEFWGLADVSAVELTTEESNAVETNKDEITVEEPIVVEANKDETTVAEANAGETYTEGDFTYSIINDNEVEIVGYIGLSRDIFIPDVTKGKEFPILANKKVTRIGDNAFKNKDFTSATFGKNINSVGKYAFYKNEDLTELDLSECKSLETIGEFAFYCCSMLTELKIDSNLSSIERAAFASCFKIKTVNIQGGTNATIGSDVFYECKTLESVTIGDGVESIGGNAFIDCEKLSYLTLGNNLKTIASSAFMNCQSLTKVTIPDSVESIGASAFRTCTSLVNVTIGSGCTQIGNSAFLGCPKLEGFNLSADNPRYTSENGIILNKDKTTIEIVPNGYSGKYIIPSTITTISSCAFMSCHNLKEVVINDNIQQIYASTFSDCSKLHTVTFSKNITSIGASAFKNNTALTEVDLSVCENLQEIGDATFSGNSSLVSVIFPDSLKTIGKEAFSLCSSINQLNFGSQIQNIKDYAFAYCRNVRELNLKCVDNAVIAYGAFSGMGGLRTVNIGGGSNITIGGYIFGNCVNLKSAVLGDGIKTIGKYSFYNNFSLSNVKIGKDVTNIDNLAFEETYILNKIQILSKNLSSIDTDGISKGSCTIYCYENTKTHDTLVNSGFTELRFFEKDINPTDIKVNDTAINNFNAETKEYTVYVSDVKNVNIVPEIGQIYASYTVTATDNVYTLDIFNENNQIVNTYKITIKDIEDIRPIGIEVNGVCVDNFYPSTKQYTVYLDDTTNVTVEPIFDRANIKYRVIAENNLYTINIYNRNNIIEHTYKVTLNTIDYPTNIKVNGVSVKKFNKANKEYTVYLDDVSNIDIVPVFNQNNINYKVTKENNSYTITVYAPNNSIAYQYKINVVVVAHPINIKINSDSINNFNKNTRSYTVFLDDIKDVAVAPVFGKVDANYRVTTKNNVYVIDVFAENNEIAYTYKVTLIKKVYEVKYTVIGDVTLTLDNISSTKVGASVALPKGTYRLKLAKDDIEFGYSKRVKDYCSLTLSDKYKGFITFDTTGGTYTFQLDKNTNKLVIKHDNNLPNEYLIGDIDTILKPVGDRSLSVGTQQLPAGIYKFKLSIGGKGYGYSKVVDDATAGSLSMNSKYTAQVTLNATGGMYTFILNTETNKLIIRHTPIDNEATTDVHISGAFNLVLNDKSATGEELTTATGTKYLEDGCYTFKIHNYGTVYTASAVINDKATKNLSSKYTTPVTLNATGGTYKFVFDKETGALVVSKL